ncbi:MAG: ArnT family glycosyltransferase [Chloroflexota bacterium]
MRSAAWLLYAPAIFVLSLYFWGFLDHAWSVVTFPYQIDYGEMPELNRAWRLARGQPIYVDWSSPPYQMANYPPLYPVVAAAGVAFQGTQFFTGRLISLASTLATGAALAVTIWALHGGRRAAVIGGLLYFVAHPVWNWGALQRVDSFAVAWELAGVAVFAAGWLRSGRRWALWATVPLFLAAVYSRQTVVAGALACYGYLLIRRPRLGLVVLAIYAAAGLVLLGVLQAATAGQFWRHIVDGNLNRWNWERVDTYWQPFQRLLHWTFPFATIAVLLGATRRQPQIPLLYLIASAATTLTIGKIGSNVNYLLQLWAALALMTGLALGYMATLGERPVSRPATDESHQATRRTRRARDKRWSVISGPSSVMVLGHAIPALWLLVGLQQVYHVPFTVEPDGERYGEPAAVFAALRWPQLPLWRLDPWAAPPGEIATYYRQRYQPNPSTTERQNAGLAEGYVATVEGDVLGEEMSFTVTTGKRVYLQPFEFTQLAQQGVWDQGPLLEDIRRQRFGAVVLRFRLGDDPAWRRERVNQAMIHTLAASYRLDAAFGDYFIYRPRP